MCGVFLFLQKNITTDGEEYNYWYKFMPLHWFMLRHPTILLTSALVSHIGAWDKNEKSVCVYVLHVCFCMF